MLAVIKTGGKQYNVRSGDTLAVEKLEGKAGDVVVLDNVLAIVDGKKTTLGADKAKVAAEILEQKKDDKVIVFKKKRRHNYRRMKGHRQQITVIRIGDIALDGNVSTKAAAKPAAEKKAPAAKKPAAKPAAKKTETKAAADKKPAAKKAPAKKPAAKKSTKKDA